MINNDIQKEIFNELKVLKDSGFDINLLKDGMSISNITNRMDNAKIFDKIEEICYFIAEEKKIEKDYYYISNNEGNVDLVFI